MTKWQWKVVLALVRYTLAKEGFEFKGSDDEQQGRIDRSYLIEAANREEDSVKP